MVIGHYFPSFAAKKVEKSIPLWLLFLAAQLIDIIWAILIIIGIEKVRIVSGITGENVLDNYYIPFTHGLSGSILLSCIAFFVFIIVRKSRREAFILSLVVFSHWLLDLVSHGPELPLWGNSYKVGFGLGQFPIADFAVQVSLFLIGIALYVRSINPITNIGKYGIAVFTVLMVSFQALLILPPSPSSQQRIGILMLIVYILTAAIAFWIERYNAPQKLDR